MSTVIQSRERRLKSGLAQQYWDLANAIVAFSVLQMLAFLYSLANKDFRGHVAEIYSYVILAIATSWVLYTAGVVGCYFAARQLLRAEITAEVYALLLYTFLVRIAIIGLCTLFGIVTLVVARHHGWP